MSPNSTKAGHDQQYWSPRKQLIAALMFIAYGGGLVTIVTVFHR